RRSGESIHEDLTRRLGLNEGGGAQRVQRLGAAARSEGRVVHEIAHGLRFLRVRQHQPEHLGPRTNSDERPKPQLDEGRPLQVRPFARRDLHRVIRAFLRFLRSRGLIGGADERIEGVAGRGAEVRRQVAQPGGGYPRRIERAPADGSCDEHVVRARERGREDDERLEIDRLPIVPVLAAANTKLGPQALSELQGERRDLVAEGHCIWLPLRLCALGPIDPLPRALIEETCREADLPRSRPYGEVLPAPSTLPYITPSTRRPTSDTSTSSEALVQASRRPDSSRASASTGLKQR